MFSQNADLFTRAINCTAKIMVCNLSAFVPVEKTSSKFQIIHYSRAPCRRDMAIQNYGDDVSFISNLDAVDIPIKVLNQCVAPKFCSDLGEMTQASCGLKHMIGWWIAALTRRKMTVIIEDDMIPERFFFFLKKVENSDPIASIWVGHIQFWMFKCENSQERAPFLL